MTSLPPTRPALLWQPRDYTVWDANRDRIYEYYLVEKKDLSETKQLMEARHGFPEHDKNMWEHVLLRYFGFRKNLSKSDWAPISQSIAKRRRLGKDTYAIDLCGVQVPRRRVEKNIPQRITLDANSPKLPRDILIRTPPPQEPSASRELQRRVNMSDLPQATQAVAFIAKMLPERILEVRRNSPFIQTMLRLSVLLESYVVTDNDIRDSFASLSQMYQQCPYPTLFGTSTSLDILSFACFSASSGADVADPRPLLHWIGKVVDLRFLHGIFSVNAPTILAFWSKLLQVARELDDFEAMKCLIEVGLGVANKQWTRSCLRVCCAIYDEGLYRRSYELSSEYVGSKIETEILAKRIVTNPFFFWQSASRRTDAAMMKILAHAGYSFIELPIPQQQRALRAVLFGYGQLKVTCLRYLLESGVTTTPVLEDGVYWHGPGDPVLARDCLWIQNGESPMLLAEFYKSSVQCDDTVTVSGICKAASDGLDSLKHYMDATPCSIVETKQVLLEISLSETAATGSVDVLDCLLDYGVNPNVPSLGRNELSGRKSSPQSWNPTLRAIENRKLEAMRRISFRHPSLNCYDCFMTVLSQPGEDCWVDTIELLETSGLNPQTFGDDAVIRAALSKCWARRQTSHTRLLKIFELYRISFDKKIDGANLLQMAIRHDCALSTVEVLLRHGVEVRHTFYENDGSEVLYDALRSYSEDRESIVELLLHHGVDPSAGDAKRLLEATLRSPLWIINLMRENLRLYRLMLKHGARWPVDSQICGTNLITLLLQHEADDGLIVDALDAGYDINLRGQRDPRTPLMEAIENGRLTMALDFIRRGANINAMILHEPGYRYGEPEFTALQVACSEGAPLSFIKTLIDLGAGVDGSSEIEAFTSLHLAVAAGHLNIASLLIARGADINAIVTPATFGHTVTPLDIAAEVGNLEMCQLLYDLGGRSASRIITDVDRSVQLAREASGCNIGVLRFFEERLGCLDKIPGPPDFWQ